MQSAEILQSQCADGCIAMVISRSKNKKEVKYVRTYSTATLRTLRSDSRRKSYGRGASEFIEKGSKLGFVRTSRTLLQLARKQALEITDPDRRSKALADIAGALTDAIR